MNDGARTAFAEVIGEGDQTALLLDREGRVIAGLYLDSQGADVSGEIGIALGPVGAEAARAMRHLGMGEWRAIVCECTDANLALAPGNADDVVVVAASPLVPIGYVRRLLDMAVARATDWRREAA